MPGGYGTSGPWGSSGDAYGAGHPSNDPEPYTPNYGPPGIQNPPVTTPDPVAPVDNTPTWVYDPEEEQTDYLGDQLVSDMSNEEVAAATGQTYNPNTGNIESYTPPSEIYGPGQATPGETGYAFQNISPSMISALGLDKIDPKIAAFFGYTPGSTNVPNELYQQYIQGSLVSGNEAVLSGESNIGTWDDLVSEQHPLFPGGLSDYYEDMDDPFTIPVNQPGDEGQQGYGYGYDYDPGSYTVAGGYGYGGDPNQMGKTPFDYGNPYSEARYAPMEQHKRMVDVNSPLYAARGGIMNLRR